MGSKPGYNRLDTGSSVMKRALILPEPGEKKKKLGKQDPDSTGATQIASRDAAEIR